MRRGIPAFRVIRFLTIPVLLLAAGAASGQYIEHYANVQDLPLPGARPSVRLMGMGHLSLTIADENNEISLSDFGGNLAGLATDRDGWSVEAWGGRSVQVNDYAAVQQGSPVRQRSRFEGELGGLDAVWHKGGVRAMGLASAWLGRDTSFRYGPDSRTRGPNFQGFLNEVRGPLSLAVGLLRWNDNEDVVSDDIFAIRHFSTTWTTSFAAGLLLSGWQLGGQVDLDRVDIRGRSRDHSGFHQDDFVWHRPTQRYRLNLIRPQGDKLAFGVNLGAVRRDGREEATISWSDRFPYNPSRTTFRVEIPTFEEEERVLSAGARGIYKLSSVLNLGFGGSYHTLDTRVTESPQSNFHGSRAEEDSEESGWRVGGGISSVLLNQRLRLGAEAFALQSTFNVKRARSETESDSRGYQINCGGELLLPSRWAVRGGFARTSLDEDVDQPLSLYVGNAFTAGIGYVPKGGIVSIDAALRVMRERPDFEGGADRERDGHEIAISARFLF